MKAHHKYERIEDMSPDGMLRLYLEPNGDIIVEVRGHDMFENPTEADVEFCECGAGGGRSSNTRVALMSLAEAMELDNKERPIPKPDPRPLLSQRRTVIKMSAGIAEICDNIEAYRGKNGGMTGDSVQMVWDDLRKLIDIQPESEEDDGENTG